MTRKIACFIYHDFQQFSGLFHTPFQELPGDVGSCLAPQIGGLDIENLDSKNPEIYHDFLQFSGKNPVSYHVFRTFPGANPDFCHVFLPFSGKNSQICLVLLTFSGENLRIFHDLQKSFRFLRLQVRRIKFSLYDGVARKDVRSFLGLSPVRRRQGCSCNLETRDLLVAGPVKRRKGCNCNLGTQDFLVAVKRRQGYKCNLGTRDFWGQAQLEDDRAAAAIWKLEIFWWQAQLKGERATNAIWELEIFCGGRPSWKATGLQLQSGNSRFLVVDPVGRRQGYNCNLGTRDFWGQAQLEGDTATTAIWELEIFGGRPSWKATGLQLQSGNSRFFSGRPS